MSDWLPAAIELSHARAPAVLVTVAAVKGSTPRAAGAKILVSAETVVGTIGGGHLELKAIEIARAQLGGQPAPALRRFPLGASLGQCCGGIANLLFEPLPAASICLQFARDCARAGGRCVRVVPVHGEGALIVSGNDHAGTLGSPAVDAVAMQRARALLADGGGARLVDLGTGADTRTCLLDPLQPEGPCVWLFGAGHVGRALVSVLAPVAAEIVWVDQRASEFPGQVAANVRVFVSDEPAAEVPAAPAGAFFLVMTHNHALDEQITEAILRRGDYLYFGLIGSQTKRRRFEQRLAARGIDAARLATMTCPIGVAGIGDKRPAAIAVATAAEVLQRFEEQSVGQAVPAARRA